MPNASLHVHRMTSSDGRPTVGNFAVLVCVFVCIPHMITSQIIEQLKLTYQKRLAKFPVRLPRGSQDELPTLFEELRHDVVAPPTHAQPRNQQISAPTWALIKKRVVLRQQGKLLQQTTHLFRRQIAAGLKGDCAKHTAAAAEKIEGHLAAEEPTKEEWQSLKGWYKAATDCTPKANKMSLAVQTAERIALYGRVSSKGDPIPSDGELRTAMRGFKTSVMRAQQDCRQTTSRCSSWT